MSAHKHHQPSKSSPSGLLVIVGILAVLFGVIVGTLIKASKSDAHIAEIAAGRDEALKKSKSQMEAYRQSTAELERRWHAAEADTKLARAECKRLDDWLAAERGANNLLRQKIEELHDWQESAVKFMANADAWMQRRAKLEKCR